MQVLIFCHSLKPLYMIPTRTPIVHIKAFHIPCGDVISQYERTFNIHLIPLENVTFPFPPLKGKQNNNVSTILFLLPFVS